MILRVTHPDAHKTEYSGGKGASLARLLAGGFPTPEGFIVPAEVSRRWLAQCADLPELLAGIPQNDPAALEQHCQILQERLAQLPLPEGLETALEAPLADWPTESAWAVRSSATTEDLAQAAFAGQHETFLNCQGTAEIARRIRDCWLSLWSSRALDYRLRAGFAAVEAAMAVVVQRLIPAEVAGVGFSLDPVSGETNHLVFDANYGLGESVVGGEMDVDHYIVDRDSLQPLSQHIAVKTQQIIRAKTGSCIAAVPDAEQTQPCLNTEELRQLATLLVKVETFYQHPVDIEWALAEGRIWLLQARPITRIPPHWTRDESAERFPNVVTPLSWDFASHGFHASLNHSLTLMGLPPYQDEWFAMFNHYIYGNQNAVAIYAERLPISFTGLDDFIRQLPALAERFAWVWELPMEWSQSLDRYLIDLGRLQTAVEHTSDLAELWQLLKKLQTIGSNYFLPNIAISITQRNLHKLLFCLLKMLLGPERAPDCMDAIMARCETKTGTVNRGLVKLAIAIRAHPALAERLTASSPLDFLAGGGFAETPEMAKQFKRFLEDHGHRKVDYDPYLPTWAEAPQHLIEHLKAMLNQPGLDAAAASARPRVSAAGGPDEDNLLALCPESLKAPLRELIRLTRMYTALDDLEHYQTTRLYLPFRRLLLKMGTLLTNNGLLAEPGDIFFTRMETLGLAIAANNAADWANLAQDMRAEKTVYLQHKEENPPWILSESGEGLAANGATESGTRLQGLPGSPGQAVGLVSQVRSPDDFANFSQGAVLVARTTNPTWTPLFYKAAAVVTESGGPLSHGAVTAREMGLPAVMAVPGVMARLKDGVRVRVDGRQGLVEILSED